MPLFNSAVLTKHAPSLNALTRQIKAWQDYDQANIATGYSRLALLSIMVGAGLSLTACGHDSDTSDIDDVIDEPVVISDAVLIDDPIITKTFSAAELKAALKEANLSHKVAKDPIGGITVHYINHTTTGLRGEATNATGAVIVPNGDSNDCQGERPITLYAHGTTPDQNYNLAALNDPNNSAYDKILYVAANYAGQGDILIAPNYPGYDKSKLDYAPYVTLQQGRQMLDGLQAGKLALDKINTTNPSTAAVKASNKLFLTGYSQGGYVTMAAAKALDDKGMPATAISPGSGPYALTAFADSLMSGHVISGGTIFLPLLAGSYEAELPKVTQGVFNPKYADNVTTICPTTDSLIGIFFSGKLPLYALFNSDITGFDHLKPVTPPSPEYEFGFDKDNYMISNEYRANYIKDMAKYPDGIYPTFKNGSALVPEKSDIPIRQAFIDNDLRAYQPKSPVLLCGGNQDSTVLFDVNSYAQSQIWNNSPDTVFALLDVDISNKDERDIEGKKPYVSTLPTLIDTAMRAKADDIQSRFKADFDALLVEAETTAYDKAIKAGKSSAEATLAGQKARQDLKYKSFTYHTTVDPYCVFAANAFFDQYR